MKVRFEPCGLFHFVKDTGSKDYVLRYELGRIMFSCNLDTVYQFVWFYALREADHKRLTASPLESAVKLNWTDLRLWLLKVLYVLIESFQCGISNQVALIIYRQQTKQQQMVVNVGVISNYSDLIRWILIIDFVSLRRFLPELDIFQMSTFLSYNFLYYLLWPASVKCSKRHIQWKFN